MTEQPFVDYPTGEKKVLVYEHVRYSTEPQSTVDVMNFLGMTRGAASAALSTLKSEGWIYVDSVNKRTPFYAARAVRPEWPELVAATATPPGIPAPAVGYVMLKRENPAEVWRLASPVAVPTRDEAATRSATAARIFPTNEYAVGVVTLSPEPGVS